MMKKFRPFIFLTLIMIGTVSIVSGITFSILYDTAFNEKRSGLIQTARSQARLMEAIAEFNLRSGKAGQHETAVAATLSQIRDAHEKYKGLGETGEFTLAKKKGDKIVFLLRHRHYDLDKPKPVSFISDLAEPMRQALLGKSGSIVGRDYRGKMVLAAHEPVAILDLGIVAKIDLEEVRAPFIRAGIIIFSISVVIVLIGMGLFFRTSTLVIGRLEESLMVKENAEKALRDNEERFRVAFENVAVGNILIDDKGMIESFNIAAEKIFGFSKEEIVGQNVKALMPEPHRNTHDLHLRKYLETGEAKVIGIGREVTGLRKDGEEFPMHLSVGEMKVGGQVSFIGSVTDLTKTQALENQLRHSQKMEAVGQLTGGIAHDFNNILSVILGNLEILGRLVSGDPKASGRVETALKSTRRGARLTHSLLGFTRKGAQDAKITSLNPLIHELEELISKSLTVAVKVELHLVEDLWPVKIDIGDFEDAILNICLNARDAMPDGGTLSIETANKTLDEHYAQRNPGSKPGDYVMVSFGDSGTGMTLETKEKVFEPFFTTKKKDKGTGLGLSMVYGFVQRSEGHIKIYSEPGQGTTFTLFLPRTQEGEKKVLPLAGIDDELPGGNEGILVVDDEEGLLDVAVTHLQELGYRTMAASSGEEALERLRGDEKIDMVFSDVVMPGDVDGYCLAREALGEQYNLKVLLTSGFTKKHMEMAAGKDDIDARLTANLLRKPYSQSELAISVRRILDEAN